MKTLNPYEIHVLLWHPVQVRLYKNEAVHRSLMREADACWNSDCVYREYHVIHITAENLNGEEYLYTFVADHDKGIVYLGGTKVELD